MVSPRTPEEPVRDEDRGEARIDSASVASLTPLHLAEALRRWALRREKMLHILDIRSALQARRLADACLRLDELSEGAAAAAWQSEWDRIRREAVSIFRRPRQ
jgi:hypothetical protein